MFGDCWPIGRPSIIWFPFLGQKFSKYIMVHQMSSWNDWDKYINIWQRKMRHVKNLGERVWKESSLELSPSTFLAENWIILARRHLWMKAVACGLVKSQPPGSTLTIWLVLPNRQANANVQGFGWGLCSCTCCTILNLQLSCETSLLMAAASSNWNGYWQIPHAEKVPSAMDIPVPDNSRVTQFSIQPLASNIRNLWDM